MILVVPPVLPVQTDPQLLPVQSDPQLLPVHPNPQLLPVPLTLLLQPVPLILLKLQKGFNLFTNFKIMFLAFEGVTYLCCT